MILRTLKFPKLLDPCFMLARWSVILGGIVFFGWVFKDAMGSSGGLAPHRWDLLITALLLQFSQLFFLMWLWEKVLRIIWLQKGPDVTTRKFYTIYSRSWLARYIPGRIWSLAGRALLAQKSGVPAIAVSNSVAAEIWLSYGLLTILSVSLLIYSFFNLGMGIVVLVVTTGVFGIVTWKLHHVGRDFLITLEESDGYLKALWRKLLELGLGTVSISRMTIFKGIGFYGLYSVMQLTCIIVVALAFVPLTFSQALILMGVWGISLTAGWLCFILPVGIGAREGIAFLALSQILDINSASNILIASRLLSIGCDLIFVVSMEILALGHSNICGKSKYS